VNQSNFVVRAIRALYLGLLLSFAAGAQAAGTLSVTEKVEVAAPPAKVWDAIKDFKGWQTWHPAIAGTDITKGGGNDKGTVRVLTTKDGAKITEELVAYDAKKHSYKYRITASPLPVADYVSTIEVKPAKNGSTVVWTSKFKAKGASDADAKKTIVGIYRAGLDNLGNVVK
jgi:carbon monoxide dehydrogenase subunit G